MKSEKIMKEGGGGGDEGLKILQKSFKMITNLLPCLKQ